jgi:hypothetical protein
MTTSGKDIGATFKKHPVGFGCGLLCLLLIVGIYYRRSEIPARESLLEQRTAEGQRLSQNLRNSSQLKEHHDALVLANAEIDKRAVGLSGLATNLAYFYRLESETGIKLLDLRQLPAARLRRSICGFPSRSLCRATIRRSSTSCAGSKRGSISAASIRRHSPGPPK